MAKRAETIRSSWMAAAFAYKMLHIWMSLPQKGQKAKPLTTCSSYQVDIWKFSLITGAQIAAKNLTLHWKSYHVWTPIDELNLKGSAFKINLNLRKSSLKGCSSSRLPWTMTIFFSFNLSINALHLAEKKTIFLKKHNLD